MQRKLSLKKKKVFFPLYPREGVGIIVEAKNHDVLVSHVLLTFICPLFLITLYTLSICQGIIKQRG